MRGTGTVLAPGASIKRITPACAGNSTNLQIIGEPTKDHPRVCGEQSCMNFFYTCNKGSPPRVRGTVRRKIYELESKRITPACAGNSHSCEDESIIRTDHPRVCGEQGRGAGKDGFIAGSPPRVRGTANAAHCFHIAGRITPACAGNSQLPYTARGQHGDHPRVCGEQSS